MKAVHCFTRNRRFRVFGTLLALTMATARGDYDNPEYAEVLKTMHSTLDKLRSQYKVPENVKQDLNQVDRSYHSAEQRKRALKNRLQ